MKKIYTTLLFVGLTFFAVAQVMDRTETDCSSLNMSIYGVLNTGKSLIVASEGFDCSICKSHAPTLQSWASQNKGRVSVWGAMTYTYSNSTPVCTDVSTWVNNYGWSDIFTFVDATKHYFGIGTPRYLVYSPKDSTEKEFYDFNDATQYALAQSSASIGLPNTKPLENLKLYAHEKQLHVKNLPVTGGLVQVINLTGAKVKEQRVGNEEGVLNLNNQSNGIYLVRVSANGQTITKRISLM